MKTQIYSQKKPTRTCPNPFDAPRRVNRSGISFISNPDLFDMLMDFAGKMARFARHDDTAGSDYIAPFRPIAVSAL